MSASPEGSAYRAVNVFLAAACVAFVLTPRSLTVAPGGDAVLFPGGRPVPSLCPFRHVSGYPCPTCQLGRSIVLASHGEFRGSHAMHPGGLLVVAWLFFQAVFRAVLVFRPPRVHGWRVDAWLSGATLALLYVAVLAVS